MARLHTYAILKTLYDQNRDYFDTLTPLVLGVLDGSFEDLSKIQKKIKRELDFEIPLHILKTVCGRAKQKGYIEQADNSRVYKIKKEGGDYLLSLEPVEDVRRRTNAFLNTVAVFFKERELDITKDQARKLIEAFIQENLDGLIDFINPKQSSNTITSTKELSKQESSLLVEFIQNIKDSSPSDYNEFKELVFGSILSSLVCVNSSSDIVEAETKNVKKAEIYFDTNITFSLLGFHSDESNLAAEELFTLLKSLGFKLRIFDFTVDEICRVMNAYISNKHRFPKNYAVDHVYSVLRKKGWDTSDVNEFMSSVEEKIEDLGIKIMNTGIVLAEYESPRNEPLRAKIAANKRDDSRGLSTAHDLAAVDKIREIRKKNVRKIEDAEAFFLTSDFALQRTVLFALGHHDSGTLSEVVLDRVLANILWLKNPSLNLPLDTIIATHSRDLLIDRKIWERFYSVLTKLRTEGTVTDSQIENLFYHNNIGNVLQEFGRRDIDSIDDSLIMEAVEEATQSISEKEQKELAERKTIEKELFETQSEQEKEAQAHNARLIEIKAGLRRKAEKDAAQWSLILAAILLLVLWAGEAYFFVNRYPVYLEKLPLKYVTALSTVYGGLGITVAGLTFFVAKGFRKWIKEVLTKWFYKRLLRAATIES